MLRAIFILFLMQIACVSIQASGVCKPDRGLRELLLEMEAEQDATKRKALECLMWIGEGRSKDLIALLNDTDPRISVLAQLSLRYIGNEEGTLAVHHWYATQKETYSVLGPIPTPLREWDYNSIEVNMLSRGPERWTDQAVYYIYALALDGSERANHTLEKVKEKAKPLASHKGSTIMAAIRDTSEIEPCGYSKEKNLLKIAKKYAFFISQSDWKYTSVKLLGTNMKKDRMLFEFHIGRGPLSTETYHSMLVKADCGWKPLYVYQVAVS